MDLSVSPKDEIWFLRVYRRISTGLYYFFAALVIVGPLIITVSLDLSRRWAFEGMKSSTCVFSANKVTPH